MEKYKFRYQMWKDSEFPRLDRALLVIIGTRFAQELFAKYGFDKSSVVAQVSFWILVVAWFVCLFMDKDKWQKKEYDRVMEVVAEGDLRR